MTRPTLNDLSVEHVRSDEFGRIYEVRSWLTRGRCATVYVHAWADGAESVSVAPFLIPSYMQGITDALILAAYRRHVADASERV